MKVIVVGAGWAGCAAAISAKKQGAEVVLVERTDMLLGTGLVGGIMRNNGRFTATEEMVAMSGGELFQLTDLNSLHRKSNFPDTTTPLSTTWRRWSRSLRNFCCKRKSKFSSLHAWMTWRWGERIKAVTGRAGRKVSPRRGCIYRHHGYGRASRSVQQIRQWLCHVHPALPFLWWKGQPLRQMRHQRNGRQKGIRSEP